MGTTLTGTTPQDTYDSLIKVTDNGPLSGTLKALSDGLGNDSTLSLSTTAASIAGTLAVTGALSGSTATFSGQGQFNAVSTGAYLLLNAPTNGGTITMQADGVSFADIGSELGNFGSGSATNLCVSARATKDLILGGGALKTMTLTSAGNVGIGTSTPSVKTEISGSASGDFAALALTNTNQAGTADAATLSFKLGRSVDSFLFTVPAIKFVKEQQWTSSGPTIDGALAFSTISNEATTEQARITSGGVLQLTQGQIKFPATQVASDNANTLDDYEEGTWTMGVEFGGASVGVTYAANAGSYTKIGRQVTVNGYLQLSSKGSSTGVATITGLPFTVKPTDAFYSSVSIWMNLITFANQVQAYADPNTTSIVLKEITELGTVTSLNDADFANGSNLMVSLTYFV
jgi:hypothetical protein